MLRKDLKMGGRGQSSASSQGIKIFASGGIVGDEDTKKLWPSAFNTGERF